VVLVVFSHGEEMVGVVGGGRGGGAEAGCGRAKRTRESKKMKGREKVFFYEKSGVSFSLFVFFAA